jgi:hypothetical protein
MGAIGRMWQAGCLGVELSVSSCQAMSGELSGVYVCSICGAENETFVDPSAGSRQTYVEDCSVCCRPQVLNVQIDEANGTVTIQAEFEG